MPMLVADGFSITTSIGEVTTALGSVITKSLGWIEDNPTIAIFAIGLPLTFIGVKLFKKLIHVRA